jgi:hypothetical protein
MDFQSITKRLMKVAQVLEDKSYFIKASKIRSLCADIGKFMPLYQTEESEKERLIAEIQSKIPGTKIKGQVNIAHDATYYEIEFRTGAKVHVSQTLGGPVRSISKETLKRPFGIYLVRQDETTGQEKLIPSGVSKSREELIPFLQKIAIGSQREVAELSKERVLEADLKGSLFPMTKNLNDYFNVSYITATGQTGEMGIYADNQEEAKKKVNKMLSIELGGQATKVKVGQPPIAY